MTKLPANLEHLREIGQARLNARTPRVTVGYGTCGRAAGARDVYETLGEAFAAADADVVLEKVGCRGLCHAEPLVEVYFPQGGHFAFGNVDKAKAAGVAEYVLGRAARSGANGAGGGSAADAPCPSPEDLPEVLVGLLVDSGILAFQERRVMSNCGEIDPDSIEEYLARGGYVALASALEGDPEDVIAEVVDSRLRGRGGAGFPTGEKWRACIDGEPGERYVIVNADEGDPGAYMDRGLLESDPHRVLEGLIIACYAIGAHQAYFFIRAEYPLAVETVRRAIEEARAAGIVGDDVLGSGFPLEVGVVRGAGAFLCGESTAMVNVLENKPCTTRPKPPHLSERGLWGAPTCINNVETLANVPLIIANGADWFKGAGTPESPGTKIFSITGAVARGGLAEVPLGVSLGYVIGDIACAPDPYAVQIGGPSGAIIPAELSDLEISYEGLSGRNGMMGSGGFVVIGRDQCVVDTASYLVHFSARQSCRKCALCRDGLDESARILDLVTAGEATEADLERLGEIAERNCNSKLCGLGRTALSPVLSSLHYFHEDYAAHLDKRCPGLVCRDLVSYAIVKEKCQGERCCLLTCPGNAIKGPFGKPGRIVSRLCQKCGMCIVTCPYGAVKKVSPAV